MQPALYSAYNILAEWRKAKDHRHFETFDFGFATSLSDLTNHLPAVRLFDVGDTPVSGYGSKYLAVAVNGKLAVFNTDIALHKVAELDITTQFNKAKELKSISELALTILGEEKEGPRLFKILANCMNSTKQPAKPDPKEGFIPHPKFMKILVDDFKFSQEDAS